MEDKSSHSPCPNCGDPPDKAYAPFCSRRCAEVDLGHWFNENYIVAGRPAEDIGGEED
ncbi:MAG: DNA gyrase inhibitor YacG [Alphaproteobacteria bacterium]|jgi:endogenous inhibitor of DNA gyrase (YacG/DUF329 family)